MKKTCKRVVSVLLAIFIFAGSITVFASEIGDTYEYYPPTANEFGIEIAPFQDNERPHWGGGSTPPPPPPPPLPRCSCPTGASNMCWIGREGSIGCSVAGFFRPGIPCRC